MASFGCSRFFAAGERKTCRYINLGLLYLFLSALVTLAFKGNQAGDYFQQGVPDAYPYLSLNQRPQLCEIPV